MRKKLSMHRWAGGLLLAATTLRAQLAPPLRPNLPPKSKPSWCPFA